jgi:glycosyltransferase involved in cell wall biosynthesis
MAYWGGGEKEMYQLATGLTSLGHVVEIYALPYTLENRRKMRVANLLCDGIKYHEGPLHVVEADVVYSMYHPFSRFNFITRAPIVASFHSQIWFNKNRKGYGYVPRVAAWLSDRLMQKELSGFAAVHTHHPSLKEEIEIRAPSHPPIYVIGHFLDTKTFRPMGTKNDRFTVLYVGRPVWQKGYDLFENLARELNPSGMRFEFAGGWGDGAPIESLGLVSNEGKLAKYMSDAHIVVSPTRIESIAGKSILEALSCGTPVVTTSQTDTSLAGCDSVFRVEDYNGMKETILYLYDKWKNRSYEEVTTCARPCALKDRSIESTLGKYEQMLTNVADRRH